MKRIILSLVVLALLSSTQLLAKYKANSIDISDYPKSEMFITAEDAIKLIGEDGVMFVSGDPSEFYANFHIRGSVVIGAHDIHLGDTNGQMKCAPLYQCVKEAEHLVGHKGISNDTLVIAYDNYKGSNASGVYSFFKSIGHRNVKMLMGGFKAIIELDPAAKEFKTAKTALKAAQKPLKLIKNVAKYTKKLAKAKKSGDTEAIAKNAKKLKKAQKKAKALGDFAKVTKRSKVQIAKYEKQMKEIATRLLVTKSRPLTSKEQKLDMHAQIALLEADEGVTPTHYTISKTDTLGVVSKKDVLFAVNDIKKYKKESHFVIVDTRALSEVTGKKKVDKVARGGHIPGATHLEWEEVVDHDRAVMLKTPSELAKVFKAKGITKFKTIYAYCQVGAGRGSHVAMALKAMGYKHVKVYTGSWAEWGNDLSLPIAK